MRKTAFKNLIRSAKVEHFRCFKGCLPQVHSWITWPIWQCEIIILWLTTYVRLTLSFTRKKVPIFSALALNLCLFSRLHHILTKNWQICYRRTSRMFLSAQKISIWEQSLMLFEYASESANLCWRMRFVLHTTSKSLLSWFHWCWLQTRVRFLVW